MSPRCTGRWCGSWRRPRGRCCTRAPWSTSRNAMNRATSLDPSSRSAIRRSTASRSATTLSDHPIVARWRAVRAERRAALIPYVTAGYPTPADCRDALRAAERAGADFVEVGVPFSDEHTSELQSLAYLVCRLLLEKKKKQQTILHS